MSGKRLSRELDTLIKVGRFEKMVIIQIKERAVGERRPRERMTRLYKIGNVFG